MDKNKTYSLEYECFNCGRSGPMSFKFGQKAPEITECINCGVTAAHRAKKESKPVVQEYIQPDLFCWL
jgi:predicted RNA-binding Zn-ribbon protein involved in translation (DUF1610 family)